MDWRINPQIRLNMNIENKDKIVHNKVLDLIFSKKSELNYTKEDEKLITKLWNNYYRKRKNIFRTSVDVWVASVLWMHSKLNFLWEHDRSWTQKSLGILFNVKPKTIGDKSREIKNLLKIKDWDDRFCRKEIAESNPLKNMVMSENGFMLTRDQAIGKAISFMPLKKTKEDYYYDGLEFIGEDDSKSIRCFKKAIEMDEEYVDAYNGLGNVYFLKNPKKAKEYYKKAYELTKTKFKKWPKELMWGILENRQYLRSIHCYGLMLWRENKNDEAMRFFKLLLKLNESDNQGIRYLAAAIYEGLSWEEMEEFDDKNEKLEKIFYRQNKKHKFFEWNKEYKKYLEENIKK